MNQNNNENQGLELGVAIADAMMQSAWSMLGLGIIAAGLVVWVVKNMKNDMQSKHDDLRFDMRSQGQTLRNELRNDISASHAVLKDDVEKISTKVDEGIAAHGRFDQQFLEQGRAIKKNGKAIKKLGAQVDEMEILRRAEQLYGHWKNSETYRKAEQI